MFDQLREAFLTARLRSTPVVVGVPLDLLKSNVDDLPDYRPSTSELPPKTLVMPDATLLHGVADRLLAARRPVLVVGRGGMEAGAGPAVRAIADGIGGLLGTSLLAKGLYDDHPFSLGIVGGYARQGSRDAARDADLVVAFGAQLSRFTLDSGNMFPKAHVVQIDVAPKACKEGMVAAHELVTGDARLAAEALLALVKGKPSGAAGVRSDALAASLAEGPADPTRYDILDNCLDPRLFFERFEGIMPRDYHLVSGSAHQAYWHTAMRGQPAGTYHAIRAFGAIGNALSFAIGVAVGRGDGKVVLAEGDGGFLMHIQELETLERHGIKLLVLCINDGAFGAEIHKLRMENVNDRQAVFGRPNIEGVARAYGLGAATVTDLSELERLMEDFEKGDTAAIWDVRVSDRVMTPPMRDEVAGLRPIR
jgi:thiamine pyrophosphate-dependent acetolactate synthase large subunit-like protein